MKISRKLRQKLHDAVAAGFDQAVEERCPEAKLPPDMWQPETRMVYDAMAEMHTKIDQTIDAALDT